MKKNKTHFNNSYDFAKVCYGLLTSDRDVTIGVAGFTGEGKTRFTDEILVQYAKISGTYWGFDRMTWSRKELLKWVNGEKDGAGQLQEYSSICPDELFYMFYKRTWFDQDQIDAVSTLNTCRDRHLLIMGNVPNLWDLDSGFLNRMRFYVYIPRRGVAWIFQPDSNPFNKDPWNVNINKKLFDRFKNPYSIPNFVSEIKFDNWTSERKGEYYKIRNVKRVSALKEKKVIERYKDLKDQRDTFLSSWLNDRDYLRGLVIAKNWKQIKKEYYYLPTNKEIGESVGLSEGAIRQIRNNIDKS